MYLGRCVAFGDDSQVGKQYSNHYSHRCGANQEDIPIFQLFCGCKFEYEAVVYARPAPHEYVASIEE